MADIPAMSIVATKTADTNGTVFQIYVGADTPRQMLIAQFLMPNADTTSLNTNVFGGAANATRTFNYAATTADQLKGLNQVFNTL
jgi:hypothetical protein